VAALTGLCDRHLIGFTYFWSDEDENMHSLKELLDSHAGDPFWRSMENLWDNRLSEGYSDWHGYGTCCFEPAAERKKPTAADYEKQKKKRRNPASVVLLMRCQCDMVPWQNSLARKVRAQLKLAINPNNFVGTDERLSHEQREQLRSVESEEFLPATVAALKNWCQLITVGPFTQFDTGICVRPSTLLRPGARVFSTSPKVGDSSFGTIGAFLKRKNDNGSDDGPNKPKDEIPPRGKKQRTDPMHSPKQAWLLSNKHVLLQRNQDLQSVEVRGAGQTLISRQITFVGERFEENHVDAAVAKVEDPSDIEAFYDGIDISCPCPLEPWYGMEVHKLGNATGVTSGTITCHLNRVFVSAPKGRGGADFTDQWLIASDDTFVANGDSGSLVIGCGHPVAMLFAMADNVKELDDRGFIPPYGLATPICDVIKNIEMELGFEKDGLEIMLDSAVRDPCPYTDLHDPRCCPSPPQKCPEQIPAPPHEPEHKRAPTTQRS
jgi:hypothetical protein